MRGRRIAVMAATVGLAGATVAGCSLIDEIAGGGQSDIDYSAMVLHPSGDTGLWLDPGYSAGIANTLSIPGQACGVAEGVLAVRTDEAIIGYNVADGSEVWQVAGLQCTTLDAAGGDLYVARVTPEGSEYVQVDIATGQQQVFYSAPILVLSTSAVARGADAVFIHAKADVGPALMAFAFDGTMLWQAAIDSSVFNCELLGAHIGCESLDSLTVLDAATGEVTVPETPIPEGKSLLWSTGGYTVVAAGISMDPETTTVYDFTGAEIGTVTDASLPMYPAATLGVAYTVEDLMTEGVNGVWMVDTEGRVIVHWDAGIRLTATNTKLSEDVFLMAGGADGSTVLYEDRAAGTVTLAAADGTVLETIDDGGADMAVIMEGLLVSSVYDGDMVTTVYPPAG